MKTTPVHQSLEILTETNIQEHVYQKPVRDADELKWQDYYAAARDSDSGLMRWAVHLFVCRQNAKTRFSN